MGVHAEGLLDGAGSGVGDQQAAGLMIDKSKESLIHGKYVSTWLSHLTKSHARSPE